MKPNGGGWERLADLILAMATFATATEYRLAGEAKPIYDVTAIRWLRANSTYHLDPTRMATGGSAERQFPNSCLCLASRLLSDSRDRGAMTGSHLDDMVECASVHSGFLPMFPRTIEPQLGAHHVIVVPNSRCGRTLLLTVPRYGDLSKCYGADDIAHASNNIDRMATTIL